MRKLASSRKLGGKRRGNKKEGIGGMEGREREMKASGIARKLPIWSLAVEEIILILQEY